MIRVIVVTVILTPYIDVIWRLLSYFGMLSLLVLASGFLLYSWWETENGYKSRPKRVVPHSILDPLGRQHAHLQGSLRKQYELLSRNGVTSDAIQRLPSTHSFSEAAKSPLSLKSPNSAQLLDGSTPSLLQHLSSLLREMLKEQCATFAALKTIVFTLVQTRLLAKGERTLQDPSLLSDDHIREYIAEPMARQFYALYKAFASHQLYHLLWLNCLSVFQDQVGGHCLTARQIKLYKDMRSDYKSVSQALPRPSMGDARHLDDFNDFSVESEDDSLTWSTEVDKVNEQVLLRLRLAGKLHPAVALSPQAQQQHLRNLFNDMVAFVEAKFPAHVPTRNRVVQIIVREFAVCQMVEPFLNRIARPEVLNSYILEKANRRIIVQKAVHTFKMALDTHFTTFPPSFLISHYETRRYTIHEKLKYADLVLRYSKKATSIIDIGTVRHEVLREMKRKSDELAGLEQTDADEDQDVQKRYLRNLAILLRKLEKRFRILEMSSSDSSLNRAGLLHSLNSPMRTPHLSLKDILEDYYERNEESGSMESLSLYYFLEYLEAKTDFDKSMNMLRFCLAAENYRKMVWRVNTGVLEEPKSPVSSNGASIENLSDFPPDMHIRFQKEVQKIHAEFLASPSKLGLSHEISESFKRYMQGLEKRAKFKNDDYLCVMKAQKQFLLQLDEFFNEFIHSDSYFRWVRDLQRIRVLFPDGMQTHLSFEDNLEVFEESALMNTIENELLESCMKLTGQQQRQKRNQPPREFEDIDDESDQVGSAIITLEDVNIEGSPSVGTTAAPLPSVPSPTSKEEEDEDEIHAPGELFNNTTKLASTQHEMDRIQGEIDRVNLLLWKLKPKETASLQDPLFIMQKHILEQTKDSLAQEMGDLAKQKAKYESQQQREALIPGQCTISIQELLPDPELAPSLTRAITYFLIQIDQKHLNSGWTVKRRYTDFDQLHRKLRETFPIVDDFDFPGKGSVLWSRARSELKGGRVKALEKYLQMLVDNKDLSNSPNVRNFLSSNYKPEDQPLFANSHGLKLTQAKLAETLTRFGVKKNGPVMAFLDGKKKAYSEDNLVRDSHEYDSDDMGSSDYAFSDEQNHERDLDNPKITVDSPLCHSFSKILLQLFDFRVQHPWLKENAAMILLDQFMGSKGEPDVLIQQWNQHFISEDNLVRFLKRYKESLLHPSLLKETVTLHPTSLRIDTKIKTQAAFTSVFSKKLGLETTTRNLVFLVEMMQNETLNRHVLFTQLDASLDLIKNTLA
ncbi:Intermediate filament protein [Kappamyces sp. JEL0829]|nr:Intermediate filament protein [Kappamyces sp. JEL0829]